MLPKNEPREPSLVWGVLELQLASPTLTMQAILMRMGKFHCRVSLVDFVMTQDITMLCKHSWPSLYDKQPMALTALAVILLPRRLLAPSCDSLLGRRMPILLNACASILVVSTLGRHSRYMTGHI